VLEKLREKDFHRLTGFQADGRARLSTWLTVAARRLCLDRHRTRYGRSRPEREPDDAAALRVVRRRLADNVGADVDTDLLPDRSETSAESETVRSERDAALRVALEALPPRDRLLLALRLDDGLSASRIAGLLDLPTPFHVYRRLSAVLTQLRVALASRGIDGVDG
jgi:RNA polymerase sigma factor (sigma-70 family)